MKINLLIKLSIEIYYERVNKYSIKFYNKSIASNIDIE